MATIQIGFIPTLLSSFDGRDKADDWDDDKETGETVALETFCLIYDSGTYECLNIEMNESGTDEFIQWRVVQSLADELKKRVDSAEVAKFANLKPKAIKK